MLVTVNQFIDNWDGNEYQIIKGKMVIIRTEFVIMIQPRDGLYEIIMSNGMCTTDKSGYKRLVKAMYTGKLS